MKKLFIAIAITSTFVACKSKTDKPTIDKELILLQQNATGSYLTDTGVANNKIDKTADVAERPNAVPAKTGTTKSSNNATASTNSGSSSNTGTNTNSGTSTNSTNNEKKGISKAAKGAIIGGVGGAVTGAVIGKNAKGAVIGGAVGATGGYIIGRSQDKKDGRVKN